MVARECGRMVNFASIVFGGESGHADYAAAKPAVASLTRSLAQELAPHILSGTVLDTCGLDELLHDWKERGAPITVPVRKDNFYMLGPAGQIRIPNWPMPPLISNHGNYIVPVENVCRWMAEEFGVEIFPVMAASEIVWDGDRETSVVVGEFGKNLDGSMRDGVEWGMELRGKYVFLGEGARASFAKQMIEPF